MYQLRNLINRTVVPSDPEKDMNAAEDFMLLLVHSFVTYAGKVDGYTPSIMDLSKAIVDKFVQMWQLLTAQMVYSCMQKR